MTRPSRSFNLLAALFAVCFSTFEISAPQALAQTCPEHKIVIPFINGVFVTKRDGAADRSNLHKAVCANPSDAAMCQNGDFELLYNQSGLSNLPSDQSTLQSALSLVTGAFQDIIETLWQIAYQNARTSPNWFDYLLYIFMHPVSANVISLMASQEAYAAAHPPTQADVASMETAMDGWYVAGDDILLTAHSQGNLFAYPVYNNFVAKYGALHIQSYGIAPPSSLIPSQYSLNSDDLVIQLAGVADRVLNPGNPPPAPNASQLCTDYGTNLSADAQCLADHGLNYYLEKQLGTNITTDLGMLYLTLQNQGYPPYKVPPVYYINGGGNGIYDQYTGGYGNYDPNTGYYISYPPMPDPNFSQSFLSGPAACSAWESYEANILSQKVTFCSPDKTNCSTQWGTNFTYETDVYAGWPGYDGIFPDGESYSLGGDSQTYSCSVGATYWETSLNTNVKPSYTPPHIFLVISAYNGMKAIALPYPSCYPKNH